MKIVTFLGHDGFPRTTHVRRVEWLDLPYHYQLETPPTNTLWQVGNFEQVGHREDTVDWTTIRDNFGPTLVEALAEHIPWHVLQLWPADTLVIHNKIFHDVVANRKAAAEMAIAEHKQALAELAELAEAEQQARVAFEAKLDQAAAKVRHVRINLETLGGLGWALMWQDGSPTGFAVYKWHKSWYGTHTNAKLMVPDFGFPSRMEATRLLAALAEIWSGWPTYSGEILPTDVLQKSRALIEEYQRSI